MENKNIVLINDHSIGIYNRGTVYFDSPNDTIQVNVGTESTKILRVYNYTTRSTIVIDLTTGGVINEQ
jgi:hypothetical protein